jgi:hypothetical protein
MKIKNSLSSSSSNCSYVVIKSLQLIELVPACDVDFELEKLEDVQGGGVLDANG